MSQMEGQPATKPDNKLGAKHIALAVGIPVVLVGVGLVLALNGDGNPEGSSITACQDAVKARLKAPSSADFQTGARETKPGTWRVVGSVDADNSFGAHVRNDFTCTVVWDAQTKSAILGGVTIDS